MGADVTDGGATVVGIEFPNRNHAQAAFAGPRRTAGSLLADLGLTEPRPMLLVIGGADSMDAAAEPRLEQLLERGAIRAAAGAGGTILDGGTASGVMATLGRAVAASDASVPLVGVAPAGKVTYPGDDRALPGATTQLEPNHSSYLLADSAEWGGETSLLFDVLDVLGEGMPRAVLLAGGGPVALDELRAATRRDVPIVVITGTGGIADELAARRRNNRTGAMAADPVGGVRDEASLFFVPLTADPADVAGLVSRLLEVDETLRDAWRQHALVSKAAGREQRAYRIQQTTILALGVALTTLVVAKAVLDRSNALRGLPTVESALHIVIILVPITIATLAAAASRMRPGTRWILLRGTSEAIKQEIFRYRARAGIYSHAQTRTISREVKLAQTVGSAMGALMRTDANLLALDQGLEGRGENAGPPDPDPDNPLAPLTAAGYVKRRIDQQIDWYRRTVTRLERQARILRWLTLVFGALGTFLAAIGLELWVAVTTAIAGASVTYLESWQLETAVTLYNQAAADLGAIRAWWLALSPAEQTRPETTDRLVERAERIMRAEHVGWVQEMQDAMTQLRLEQALEDTHDDIERSHGDVDDDEKGRTSTRIPRDSAVV
jgi:hypothetical protein